MSIQFVYDDGGRKAAGYKGEAGDCVCRAVAIATKMRYQDVYLLIDSCGKLERMSKTRKSKSSARTGVHKPTIRRLMDGLGWEWTPTMGIGTGCKVHLAKDELPSGRLIVSVSKHCIAVIDGVLHDTSDCSREGRRCVYGYFSKV